MRTKNLKFQDPAGSNSPAVQMEANARNCYFSINIWCLQEEKIVLQEMLSHVTG